MKRLAIIGSALGGGACQIIEALRNHRSLSSLFILDKDADALGYEIHGVSVTGSTEDILKKWANKEFDDAIIAIGGDLLERKRLFDLLLSNNIPLINVIDDSVRLGINVRLGKGNVILNDSYIGNNVTLGNNNYILNQCSIQHDSIIGSHNYFATNVTVGAKVKIGYGNRFGIKCIIESKSIVENALQFKSGCVVS